MTNQEGYADLNSTQLNTKLFELYSRFPLSTRTIFKETPPESKPDIGFNVEISGGDNLSDETREQIKAEFMMVTIEHIQRRGIIQRRENSLVREIFLEDFEALSSFSPATASFINYAKIIFKQEYDNGINREDLSKNSFYWILDRDEPDLGGMFDLERLKILEPLGYRKLMDQFLERRYIQERVEKRDFSSDEPVPSFFARRSDESRNFGSLRNHPDDFVKRVLPIWRQEIWGKYEISI